MPFFLRTARTHNFLVVLSLLLLFCAAHTLRFHVRHSQVDTVLTCVYVMNENSYTLDEMRYEWKKEKKKTKQQTDTTPHHITSHHNTVQRNRAAFHSDNEAFTLAQKGKKKPFSVHILSMFRNECGWRLENDNEQKRRMHIVRRKINYDMLLSLCMLLLCLWMYLVIGCCGCAAFFFGHHFVVFFRYFFYFQFRYYVNEIFLLLNCRLFALQSICLSMTIFHGGQYQHITIIDSNRKINSFAFIYIFNTMYFVSINPFNFD